MSDVIMPYSFDEQTIKALQASNPLHDFYYVDIGQPPCLLGDQVSLPTGATTLTTLPISFVLHI